MSSSCASTPPSTSKDSTDDIIEKINGYLCQNPSSFEITILPTATNHQSDDKKTSKQLSLEESILLVENHLGLDARSLPWMTQAIRQEYRHQRKHEKTGHSCALFKITSCLLLVNPDHATVWADRRKCLLHQISTDNTKNDFGAIQVWSQELKYVNLLMTQHSKAPSSWGHRKYTLQRLLQTLLSGNEQGDSSKKVEECVRQEISLCTRIAEAYPKNYYAWTHRRFLWTLLIKATTSITLPHKSIISLLQEEFQLMITWLETHVSDHSAAHYGGQVLQLWLGIMTTHDDDDGSLASIRSIMNVVKLALTKSQGLMERNNYNASHETLWMFRRLVVTILLKYGSTSERRDVNDKIQELVCQQVDSVQKEIAGKFPPTEPTDAPSLHPWTFLAWCHVQLQEYETKQAALAAGTSPVSSTTAQQRSSILSVLHDHPRVTHLMWKQRGSAILSTTAATTT